MKNQKRLRLSDDEVICGVCGGIAERFDIDPVYVRVIFGVGSIVTSGAMTALYFLLYWAMPYSKRRW